MTADIIVVIENGKIIQIGTHNDLIKLRKGIYKKLWEIQKEDIFNLNKFIFFFIYYKL